MSDVRVILVGPSDLDRTLRRDPRIELVRVRTALDAIAELGDPVDSESPARAIVLLTPGAAPPEQDLFELAAGLRRVDPAVRFLRVSDNGHTEPAPPYDGAISTHESADRLWLTLTGESSPAPDPSPAPAPTPTAPPVAPADDPRDESLVRALLRGRDVLEPAMEQIRSRLGDGCAFSRGEEGPGEAVRWHERNFGWLSCDGAPRPALAGEASWLAGWLRLAEQQEELRRAALTDPLTGAWNRRYFDRFLPVAIEQARASRASLTVLVFDIDDFKRYNEQFGHTAGDEILIETVRLIRSVIRPTDRVCRIGGDEFAVIFHEPRGPRSPGSRPPESVYDISRRFQQQICQHKFPKLGDQAPGTLTISGGLATYPWDGRDARDLLEFADALAMRSKRQGKNAITLGPGAARECARQDAPDGDDLS
ncbi:MAG: GGDEF domain-containing protein [Phycisphaeraceae bacterium]|nr:GGDEF domain-containing protein [Phycisphaeraceae bacterium]